MSFTMAQYSQPAYAGRKCTCKCCHQGIVAGARIIIGTGYWNGHLIKQRYHLECFLKAQDEAIKNFFFKNDYKPRAMAPEKKAQLNRLRARRYYIKQKGGDNGEVNEALEEVEKRIALVKSQ